MKKETPSWLCLNCSQSVDPIKVHICDHCGHIWVEGVPDNKQALSNLYEKLKKMFE